MFYDLTAKTPQPNWPETLHGVKARQLRDGSITKIPVLPGVNIIIMGIPGNGKTVLTKEIAQGLFEEDPELYAVFFQIKPDDFTAAFLRPQDKVISFSPGVCPEENLFKIITPGKTYDLQNESDEQFTDMKFMFSRYELKTINKRLVRGRNQSASEGKFMGSMAPYGYRPYKLQGQKGNSLRIEPEEAKVVQMIFDMYGKQGMGYNAIAYALNDMHIPARKGEWSQTSIVNILTNEVYLGKIRWRREPVKKVVKDGFLAKTRILNDDYELYDGLHEPIITEEQWEMAKAAQKKKGHHSTHASKELKNPFAGILFCEKCGTALKRNVPGKNQGTAPWFRCPNRNCDCRIVKCYTVEEAIRDAMEDWLDEYIIQLNSDSKPKIDPIATALEAVQAQLAGLQQQQDNLCDYLEKGVYTIEMFTKRNAALAREIKQLQASEADLMRKQESGSQANQAAMEIIPTTQHILDNYDVLTIAEKNRLWKLVLKKATVYRTPDGELSVHIYPKLPK